VASPFVFGFCYRGVDDHVLVFLYSCSWVRVNGTLYKEGFVVVRDVRRDLPLFGRIDKIICVDTQEIFFYLEALRSDGLDQHPNAYSVEPDFASGKVLVKQQHLVTHEPVQEPPFEGQPYVILRRSVQAWMD